MQSRYHNPHSKWPYHERNNYIFLLKCYLPGWITIIYFTTYNICLFGLCTRRKYMNANRAVINTLHHRNVFLIYCLSDKTISLSNLQHNMVFQTHSSLLWKAYSKIAIQQKFFFSLLLPLSQISMNYSVFYTNFDRYLFMCVIMKNLHGKSVCPWPKFSSLFHEKCLKSVLKMLEEP